MEMVKSSLLFIAAHWAVILPSLVLFGRSVGPVVPSVEAFVKSRLPRLAHFCAAVDAFIKHVPNLEPTANYLFKMATGKSWEEASAVQRGQ